MESICALVTLMGPSPRGQMGNMVRTNVTAVFDELSVMAVHAHPDDESSKGAATVARYHSEGVHTVLVTCTGGEVGEILNPAMDREDVRADLSRVRRKELELAAKIIGYDEVVLLGYRDSGMAGTETNDDPRSFARAPFDEAVGRLVSAIRLHRPQVLITYDDEQAYYPHPDHIRTHEISVRAFEVAGDPQSYVGTGDAFQPLKLYYHARYRERFLARHQRFLDLGLQSPYEERIQQGWLEKFPTVAPTTFIDVSDFVAVRNKALLAHATQIDPTSAHWFGLPELDERELMGIDYYTLARDLAGVAALPEDDLFDGIRELVEG